MLYFTAKLRIIMIILGLVYFVDGHEIKNRDVVEARGKENYALVLNLAIVLAIKVGLYKIFLAIAFLVAAMKAMVLMAWSLTIHRYIPYNLTYEKTPVHFLYVAATKLFILKIIYGAIFYVVVYKAWHLVLWLLKYLKYNKHHHYEDYDHAPAYHDHDHEYYGHDFEHAHEPYGGFGKPIYGGKEYLSNKVYDADGSYSVQN